jgi:RNA polymerase sigma-70 factor (ECF subfamily)
MKAGENSSVGRAWRAGSERWPLVRLSFGDFAAHIAGLQAETDAPSDADLALHASDLYLVTACVGRDANALAALERDFLSDVPRAVARVDPGPAFGVEVAQVLRERLLCPPLERLRHFTGIGSLASWLRVAAKRLAVDLKRREGSSRRRAEQLSVALANADRDPEWQLIRRRYRAPLETALRAALDGLAARDRVILRLYLLRGDNIDAIGRIYGVHRATIARWIVSAQRRILEAVTGCLEQELGFSPEECRSLARDLKSGLELTLERML